jgi:proteasome lid subunit RPN8/RPN11
LSGNPNLSDLRPPAVEIGAKSGNLLLCNQPLLTLVASMADRIYSQGKRNAYFIRSSDLRRLRALALTAQGSGQQEVCGILSRTRLRQLELWFLPNRSSNAGSFRIERTDYLRSRREIRAQGKQPIGTFHSHPISEAIPAKGDLSRAALNSLCLIYDVCGRTTRLWKIVKRRGRRCANEIPLANISEPNRRSRTRTK